MARITFDQIWSKPFYPMKEIAKRPKAGPITEFEPDRHRLTVAALEFTIDEAKRIRDWPALETAVDSKIDEQRQFAAWWRATVERAGGDRQSEDGRPLDPQEVNSE